MLYERYYEDLFQKIISTLSGVIFLGSPHPTYDKVREWDKLSLILKACTKISKKQIDRAARKMATIANVSRKYELARTPIHVLSVYETRPTRVGSELFSSKREIVSCRAELVTYPRQM